jgi:hypothetical protein
LVDGELTEQQVNYLLSKFPFTEKDLHALRDSSAKKTISIKSMDEDLSFEAFWSRFGKKIHPHRCEPLWKKLSDSTKQLALNSIAPYSAYLSRSGGIAQVSPENFIKRKYWLTDWSKE